MIVYGHCGRVVTGEKKQKTSPDGTKRVYNYYRCSRYKAKGHPKVRLTEGEIHRRLLALFATIRLADSELRQWFVEVIQARATVRRDDNKRHRVELQRQHEQVEVRLATLLEMRMTGEITPDGYVAKRAELHDRQSALRVQLESSDRDDREIAELAVKAFELPQSLRARWVPADYAAKRTILGITLESARLNSGNLEFCLRNPFDLLRNEYLVPLIGAMGI